MATTTTLIGQSGYDVISSTFLDTSILGMKWIIPALIIVITMFLITRDMNKFKVLLAPVVATWFVLGMKSNFMLALIVVALPIFAIEVLSLTSLNPIKIIKGKERMELEKTITEARRRRLKSSAIDASKEDPFKKASAIASELTKDYSIGSKAKRAWKKLWE